MKTTTKIWLITAALLILLGCIIFGGVMTMLKWDFGKLSTVRYESSSYEIADVFTSVSINTSTADIVFALSEDGKCRVECYEEAKAKHSVTVSEDTLFINILNEKRWYDYIGINFNTPKLTVYLPESEYASLSIKGSTGDVEIPSDLRLGSVDISLSTGDVELLASAADLVKIKTSTGSIRVENISAGALDLTASTGSITVSSVNCAGEVKLKVSTGSTKLSGVNCESITSSGSTGNITLSGVIAKEKLSIKRSTGGVKLDGCDASEIFIETDTGNVKGTLLSEKVFITETDTGNVNVPKSVSGGRCEISTDTGNIKIEIAH